MDSATTRCSFSSSSLPLPVTRTRWRAAALALAIFDALLLARIAGLACRAVGWWGLLAPLLKGFGIWEEEPEIDLLVLRNHAHVPRIAEEMASRFQAEPPRVPGFLIRDHGLTAWGRDADAALNHVELFEYIFGYMAAVG